MNYEKISLLFLFLGTMWLVTVSALLVLNFCDVKWVMVAFLIYAIAIFFLGLDVIKED